ncbi:membrane-bound transcription factor site-1 protease [Vigna unguiculata]|uniref:Membrane-bound transcription factor site-1 protease n=1 Tax=Vigna unguiculata TaxID=3917 RepID=A0A4D6LN52_VIGUN|nr:membrane-bound transcription factor site-1 protease [Vigna unguiculata]
MSFCEAEEDEESVSNHSSSIKWARELMMQRSQVTSMFGTVSLWAKGYNGAKVKIAIFETGIQADHPYFRNIKERTNWIDEDNLSDNNGHGIFVVRVDSGNGWKDFEKIAFNLFQVTYTWFLDAFNYAIATNMDELNLSFGGYDYLDLPFVEQSDTITYGRGIMGTKITVGCKRLSGTSVASPIAVGVVSLLVSVIPEHDRKSILNPTSMKKALVEGAAKLPRPNIYEQDADKADIYIPRDALDIRNDILDWHGNHLHINFHIMFNILRDAGYYIETLGLVDLEDEYFIEGIEKLRDDVVNTRLGLVVFVEWYNIDSMVKMRFFDDKQGADKILNGDFSLLGEQNRYASRTNLVRFSMGGYGYVHNFPLDSSESGVKQADSPILGLMAMGEGRIVVHGDSNCLDDSSHMINYFSLLRKILDFTSEDVRDPTLFSNSINQDSPLYEDDNRLPSHITDVNFSAYSTIVGKEFICETVTRFEISGTKGYNLQVRGRTIDEV